MGLETRYVCDVCGAECHDPAGAFVVAIRRPPSQRVDSFYACDAECYAKFMRQKARDAMDGVIRPLAVVPS